MKFSLATAIFKLLVSVPWCRADGMLLPSTGKETFILLRFIMFVNGYCPHAYLIAKY